MTGKKKVDVGGGAPLSQNPFAGLDRSDLPAGAPESAPATRQGQEAAKGGKRGRVEIRREKSGRGGKIVTTASAFQGACPAEQQEWVSQLRKSCGTGGTWRPGVIEIQGDRRDDLVRFFEEKGFRPVLAGG
jgi:translation initiation factor 1